jgi:hypothetical protein
MTTSKFARSFSWNTASGAILGGLAAVAFAGAAHAAPVVFNFDDLTVGQEVGTYNGAVFTDFIVLTGEYGYGESSPPNFAYNGADIASFDYAPGFTSLSFTAGVFAPPVTVNVFSGLDGTGTLLGVLALDNPPYSPFAFAPATVAFSGTAHSVFVFGGQAQFGWDDVTLNAVPEPATWSLLVTGFGLVGAAVRRRQAAVAA